MDDRSPDHARIETDEQEEARMRHALSMMRGAPDSAGRSGGADNGSRGAPDNVGARGPAVAGGGMRPSGGPGRRPGAPPSGSDRHAPGARRHRFVQDGEVPVVTVQRPRRDAPLPFTPPAAPSTTPAELAAERSARADAERRLVDTQQLLRSFQTRLGDAELARDRAEADLRELRVAHQVVQAERAALEHALSSARPAAAAPSYVARATGTDAEAHAPAASRGADPGSAASLEGGFEARRPRRRPAGEIEDGTEPEPVKWWI